MTWKCFTLSVVGAAVARPGKATRRFLRVKAGLSVPAARAVWRTGQAVVCVLIPGAFLAPPIFYDLPPWASIGPTRVYSDPVAVPEPATWILLGMAVVMLLDMVIICRKKLN